MIYVLQRQAQIFQLILILVYLLVNHLTKVQNELHFQSVEFTEIAFIFSTGNIMAVSTNKWFGKWSLAPCNSDL